MTYNIYRTKTPGGEVCRILCCINVAPVIWSWTLFATNTWNLHASLFMYEDMIWESVHKYSLSVSIWSSSFNEALILAEVTAAESSLILGCMLSLQVQPMPLPWPDYNGSHSDCFCTSGKSKNHIWWCCIRKMMQFNTHNLPKSFRVITSGKSDILWCMKAIFPLFPLWT